MREYPYQSDATLQTYERETEMLRGYDPPKEIFRWNIVVAFLASEACVCGLAMMPAFSSPSTLASGGPWLTTTMIALLLSVGIAALFIAYLLYRKNRKQRVPRYAALRAEYGVFYPFALSQPFSLPLRIESRVKRTYVRQMIILMLPALALFVYYGVITLGHPEGWPDWLITLPGIVEPIIMLTVSMGIPLMVQSLIATHYCLPSLSIDNDGVSARYGRDTISMRWHDIRYLAVTKNMESLRSTTSKSAAISGTLNREIYEISDGENIICWLRQAPFSSHRLLQNGEVAFSDQQYTTFAQQLASLVIERTGLPLYDFRPRNAKL